MAKSSRARSVKANNRRLKANVFGPVESARTERLSAKLLELASQPKPQMETDENLHAEINGQAAVEAPEAAGASSMDVDDAVTEKSSGSKKVSSGKIQKKKRPSKIVFPKYKDRRGKKKI